jgi:hypothetical protein
MSGGEEKGGVAMSAAARGGEKKEAVTRIKVTAEVSAINEVDQTFNVTGIVRQELKVEGLADAEKLPLEDVKKHLTFLPDEYLLLNGQSMEFKPEDMEFSVEKGVLKGFMGYEATCGEQLNMQRFPFDRQILSLPFQAWGKVADDVDASGLRFEYLPHSWYALVGGLTSNWRTLPPKIRSVRPSNGDQPRIELQIFIERRPSFFLYNVVLPLAIICGLVLTNFALPIEELGGRLQGVLTLLLTAIAFKFVVTSYIPKLPYLTLLDKYILCSYLLIFFAAVENALVYIWRNYEGAQTADHVFILCYGSLWFLINFFFYIGTVTNIFYEPWESAMATKERLDSERDDAYMNAPETDLSFPPRGKDDKGDKDDKDD